MFDVLRNFPDPKIRYVLAVQPFLINMFRLTSILAETVGDKSNLIKIKMCHLFHLTMDHPLLQMD